MSIFQFHLKTSQIFIIFKIDQMHRYPSSIFSFSFNALLTKIPMIFQSQIASFQLAKNVKVLRWKMSIYQYFLLCLWQCVTMLQCKIYSCRQSNFSITLNSMSRGLVAISLSSARAIKKICFNRKKLLMLSVFL